MEVVKENSKKLGGKHLAFVLKRCEEMLASKYLLEQHDYIVNGIYKFATEIGFVTEKQYLAIIGISKRMLQEYAQGMGYSNANYLTWKNLVDEYDPGERGSGYDHMETYMSMFDA